MKLNTTTSESALKRRKQIFGLSYGIVAGLAFSITLWGPDGFDLFQANAYYPWAKFVIGTPLVMLVCGLAGWLTSRLEKPLIGVFLWIAAAGALAWLAILVPIVFFPVIVKALNPQLSSLLQYSFYDNASEMVGVAFAWIVIGSFIIAAVQVPMIEQATFSNSLMGKIAPHLICTFLMLVSGSVADGLNNQSLREPLVSLDKTIQYSIDHQGETIDPKIARDLHIAALRSVQETITADRRLVVSWYDPLLEDVNILVNFNGNWVECSTIFNHPLNCQAVSP